MTGCLGRGETPVETGKVAWSRDLEGSLTASRQSGKPVLLLFQEVPGCAGCREFGREVLGHDGLVDAIESHFEPVVVYNNRGGKDAEILRRFGEPSWNYQVIRFFDGEGVELIPRRDRVWTLAGVAHRMVLALEKAGRNVPGSLRDLAAESDLIP